jgi:hypothetical protein
VRTPQGQQPWKEEHEETKGKKDPEDGQRPDRVDEERIDEGSWMKADGGDEHRHTIADDACPATPSLSRR